MMCRSFSQQKVGPSDEHELLGAFEGPLTWGAAVGSIVGAMHAVPLHPVVLASMSGVGLALAAPPHDNWPLALVALVPLSFAVRRLREGRRFVLRAAGLGAWMALVAQLVGMSWLVPTLEQFARLPTLPAACLAMSLLAGQSLLFALWLGGCAWLKENAQFPWVFTGPLLLAILEGLMPRPVPWPLAVTVWEAWPLVQIGELGGAPAVSALVVLINLTLADFARAVASGGHPTKHLASAGVVILMVLAGGGVRAWQISEARTQAPVLRVGLVQPNFGVVTLASRQSEGEHHLRALRMATESAASQGAQLTVLPETAWPFLLDRSLEREFAPSHPWALRRERGGRLLLGALTHRFGSSAVYNSAVLFSEAGRIGGMSDKTSLLPFAEYIPLSGTFPRWARDVEARLPASPQLRPGQGEGVLVDGTLRIAPLICSDELSSRIVLRLARQNANLLVGLVNDAWFVNGGAALQHLALASLRAVETRRDLVHDTHTGISAIVDALGRVRLAGPPGGPGTREPLPTVLVGDVALLESFSPGPYVIGAFPYVCALVLLAGLRTRHRSRLFAP